MLGSDSFEALLTQEFRWPRKGDRPFSASPHPQINANIDHHEHMRMFAMTTGYKMAADFMVEKSAMAHYERDCLVFPIIFNYRQYLELSLKYLLSEYGPVVGVNPIWDSHDLARLWREFAKVLSGFGLTDSNEADLVVAKIIAEFAKIDPKSYSYRYPVDTKGNPIPITYHELDLVALADVMKGVEGYFGGCDGWLDSLKSAGP